jgi:hypothetical protein
MEDIKKLPKTQQDFDNLNKQITDCCDEKMYVDGKDWTKQEIDLFVSQFQHFQEDDPIVDMDKLDPKFIPLCEFEKKFSGFDDSVIQMLYECENKKLEDARIPPLRINPKSVTLTDNFSNTTYIDDESKTKCQTSCKNNIGGLKTEKKEKKKEEEVSI